MITSTLKCSSEQYKIKTDNATKGIVFMATEMKKVHTVGGSITTARHHWRMWYHYNAIFGGGLEGVPIA